MGGIAGGLRYDQGMERDWAKTIRARNARELVSAGVLAGLVLFTQGLTLHVVPLLAAVAWVALFFLRFARWKASPSDGGVGVRRELIRQGHLLRAAWAWYVLPLVVGGLVTWGGGVGFRAAFIVGGAVLAVVNYRAGQKLIDEGNR
jgi:hypothetical protein